MIGDGVRQQAKLNVNNFNVIYKVKYKKCPIVANSLLNWVLERWNCEINPRTKKINKKITRGNKLKVAQFHWKNVDLATLVQPPDW